MDRSRCDRGRGRGPHAAGGRAARRDGGRTRPRVRCGRAEPDGAGARVRRRPAWGAGRSPARHVGDALERWNRPDRHARDLPCRHRSFQCRARPARAVQRGRGARVGVVPGERCPGRARSLAAGARATHPGAARGGRRRIRLRSLVPHPRAASGCIRHRRQRHEPRARRRGGRPPGAAAGRSRGRGARPVCGG